MKNKILKFKKFYPKNIRNELKRQSSSWYLLNKIKVFFLIIDLNKYCFTCLSIQIRNGEDIYPVFTDRAFSVAIQWII